MFVRYWPSLDERKNKDLEERLRVVEAGSEVGRRDTVQGHQEGAKCVVLGDYNTECGNRRWKYDGRVLSGN